MDLTMCALCQSIKKNEPFDAIEPEQNKCYEARTYTDDYHPFKKDKRTVKLTCNNFSHIKTAVLNLRGGGQVVLRATPEMPKVELSRLGPLFEQDSVNGGE